YDFIGPRKTGKPVCKYLTLSFIPPEFAGFQFFTLDVFEYDFVRRDDQVIIRQPLCILRRQGSVWFLIFVERDQDSFRKNILDGNRVFPHQYGSLELHQFLTIIGIFHGDIVSQVAVLAEGFRVDILGYRQTIVARERHHHKDQRSEREVYISGFQNIFWPTDEG